ncbi:MipA/OmpV family protein [Sulfitobacter sp.]|uniref:MipA/OmpV family protein n=1 Tax=Sulfitobacter sp. TaxID=1903071 RepID=UPI0030036CFC
MRVLSFVTVSALALGTALPVMAQDRSFNFALGLGVGAAPEYMGSDSTVAVAAPTFTFGSLKWGAIDTGNGVRGIPDNGVSLNAAFRVLGDRTAEDSPELAGLEDIDIAVELGFGLAFQQTNWMAFGEIRKGVTGHNGVTGTLGADLILRPNDRFVIKAGPRVNFGNDEFANTYFGVPTGGTATFAGYDATGGALGAGVQVTGTYFLDDNWSLEGGVSYEMLLGDAADSPITMNGSEDQWRIQIGLSRQFTLNF